MKEIVKWAMGQKREFKFDPNSTENEGRFRLLPPKLVDNYYREKSGTGGISFIKGTMDGKDVIQAIRFDKSIWTEDKAREWFNKGKFSFYKLEIK